MKPAITLTCKRCGHDNYPCRGEAGTKRACSCQLPGCVQEGQKRCGYSMRMPANRPLTEAEARSQSSSAAPSIATARQLAGGPDPALVQAWAKVPEWTDDDDAIMWRPDGQAGNCETCGRACLAEPGRTMVCCPSCWWWGDYPEVVTWRDLQRGKASRAAERGAPEPQLTQAELDAASRELHIRRGRVLAVLGKVLDDDRLTVDCRSTFEWYRSRILAPGITVERLGELEEQLADEPVQRRWRRAARADDYLADDYLADDDQADDDQADDDDDQAEADAELPRPRTAIAAPAGNVLCEPCHGTGQLQPAAARIFSPQASWLVPERDVCQQHYGEAAESVERMTFVNLVVLKSYSSAAGIRSIIKVGAAAALNGSPR